MFTFVAIIEQFISVINNQNTKYHENDSQP